MARGVEAFSEMQADSKGIGRTVMVHSPEGNPPAVAYQQKNYCILPLTVKPMYITVQEPVPALGLI